MFSLSEPSPARVKQILASQKRAGFSYDAVGATRDEQFPNGFNVDRHAITLGTGDRVFAAARQALRRWEMMDLGWVHAIPASPSIEVGTEVAVVVRHFGFWSVNVSRVVYVLETESAFGFAYGTLREHAESGEELFSITRRDDGSVWYEIVAFSRPRHVLANAGYPLTRVLQSRFAQDSMRRMAQKSLV